MQDLNASNLIVGSQDLEDVKGKQQEFAQQHPDFKPLKCSGDTPYLSKVGCIACTDPTPYFNIEIAKCAKCPELSLYNPELRSCQKGGKQYLSNL